MPKHRHINTVYNNYQLATEILVEQKIDESENIEYEMDAFAKPPNKVINLARTGNSITTTLP